MKGQFLYGRNSFSISWLSIKIRYSNFLKNVLKMFKVSSDCRIKTYRCLKRRTFLKIPSIFFGRTYALSAGFKMKSLKKVFSCVKAKTNSNIAVKLTKRGKHSFFVYESTFLKHLYCFYIKLNWLCKQSKKVRCAAKLLFR